jgi:hypothetical protein
MFFQSDQYILVGNSDISLGKCHYYCIFWLAHDVLIFYSIPCVKGNFLLCVVKKFSYLSYFLPTIRMWPILFFDVFDLCVSFVYVTVVMVSQVDLCYIRYFVVCFLQCLFLFILFSLLLDVCLIGLTDI